MDEHEPQTGGWLRRSLIAAAVLVVGVAVYVLSVGPAVTAMIKLGGAIDLPGWVESAFEGFYAPLIYAAEHWPWFEDLINAYVGWWFGLAGISFWGP